MAGNWEKVKRIFADAVKDTLELRLQFLDEVCEARLRQTRFGARPVVIKADFAVRFINLECEGCCFV